MKGSVRKRGKNSWELTIDLGRDANGKRVRKFVNVKGKRADADRKLRELITQVENGLPIETDKVTVGEYMERWTATHSARVRPRTIYGYRNVIARYIVPTLGNLRLVRLQPTEIENLYANLIESGLSPRTVLQAHRIFKKALKQAVRWGVIGRSPADLVDAPSFERKEMSSLTVDQLNLVLERCADIKFGGAIALAAFTGMRRGELAGLKWADIDFDNQVVSVRREIVFVPGQGYLVAPPKSAKGRRALDITISVVELLRRLGSQQAEQRLRAGSAWAGEDWVFTDHLGNHINPNRLSYAFKGLREELGLPPVRLHDLRHTHASVMLQAGVHLKVVQERLGHSTIAITADTYSHVTAGLQRAAANDFEAVLRSRSDEAAGASG